MGSLDPTSQPWPPYGSVRDCSLGFCSIYCPQWCYFIFPPPPPARPSDASGANFSPLVIAIIGVLSSAFLLICYYTVVSRYCSRARRRRAAGSAGPELLAHSDAWRISNRGLDEAAIKAIAVHEYRRGGQLAGATDCSVCLSEFVEEEKVRLLPKCGHAFHVPCIDTWLKSHSNCPLCRANILPPLPPPPPPPQPPLLLSAPSPPPPPALPPASPSGHDRATSESEMEVVGEEVAQPMRRSVSMDSICLGRVMAVGIDVEEEPAMVKKDMKRSASSSSGRFDLFGGRSFCRGGRSSTVLPL